MGKKSNYSSVVWQHFHCLIFASPPPILLLLRYTYHTVVLASIKIKYNPPIIELIIINR